VIGPLCRPDVPSAPDEPFVPAPPAWPEQGLHGPSVPGPISKEATGVAWLSGGFGGRGGLVSRSNARISAIPLIFNICCDFKIVPVGPNNRAVSYLKRVKIKSRRVGWDSDMVVWGMMRAAHMLTSLLGRDVCAHLRPLANWARDPLAQGSYSYALPGNADARATLAAPVDERLFFFAGEACSRHDFSTAHGACLTGLEAADEVIALRPRRIRHPEGGPFLKIWPVHEFLRLPGFFNVDHRLKRLSDLGDQLEGF
jgi:hypothetical protein